MGKKHLITCSVIAVLAIISSLNIFSTIPVFKPKNVGYYDVNLLYKIPGKTAEEGYNFAHEALPLHDKHVNVKLKKSLATHRFRNIQSNILHAKADKLFPVIEPILKFYGIPEDFKFIPLVESGLCEGTSPKGAKGIWQFMPGTARTYGLKVGHGKDERMNIRKSTIAACKYIKELYGEFHSWTLTAAAYNNGSVKLARVMRKQNQKNYFHMVLNRETGIYVYNIIAMKEVINKPAKYGYKNFYSYIQKPSPLFLASN